MHIKTMVKGRTTNALDHLAEVVAVSDQEGQGVPVVLLGEDHDVEALTMCAALITVCFKTLNYVVTNCVLNSSKRIVTNKVNTLFMGVTSAIIVNVCEPYVVTLINRTSTFEWYMARFVVKNGYQKDMYRNEIGL